MKNALPGMSDNMTNQLEELATFNGDLQRKLTQLCKPLFKNLGLNYFGHARLFHDYTGTAIISNHELVKPWVEMSIPFPVMFTPGFYLVSSLGNFFSPTQLSFLKDAFDMDNLMFAIEKEKDYMDCYLIAGNPGDKKTLHHYINNMDLIKKFFCYFKQQTDAEMNDAIRHKIYLPVLSPEIQAEMDLIDLAVPNKQYLDELSTAISKNSINESLNNLKKQLVKFTSSDSQIMLHEFILHLRMFTKFFPEVDTISRLATLSDRELQCVCLLAKGATAKMIGTYLNISYRTVEIFIDHARKKLGCVSKQYLSRRFWEAWV